MIPNPLHSEACEPRAQTMANPNHVGVSGKAEMIQMTSTELFQPSVLPPSKGVRDIIPSQDCMRRDSQGVRDLIPKTSSKAYIEHIASQRAGEVEDDVEGPMSKYGDEDTVSLISSQVIGDLLGTEHSGFRSFMYHIDPFKEEQFVRAPKKYMDINFVFAMLYFGGVIGYSIWALIYYSKLPPIETNTTVLASSLPPVSLQISTSCSSTWNCGDWRNTAGTWVLNDSITITQVWDHVADDSPCKARNGQMDTIATNGAAEAEVSYELCSSSSNLDGIYLKVPFSSAPYGEGDIYLNVLVSSAGNDPQPGYTGMQNTQHMAMGELKSVYVSQTVYDDTLLNKVSQEPYVADLFYDGHTTASYANLGFKSQQFARHVQIQDASSLMTIIGTIGGFAGILLTALAVARVVTVMTFARFSNKEQSQSIHDNKQGCSGKVGEIVHECFQGCCNNNA